MKKIVTFFPAFLLIFSSPVLFAQMSLGVSVAPGISQDLARVGVVAAAGGKVELTTPGQIGRVAQSGQAIFMGDEVKTDASGHLQILLLDETVFTIGPNSTITIDQFVYDPKSQKGEIRASIAQGVFRYVSGKIAAKNPDSVKVKLPTASIGFRGTIVGGSVGANGQGLAALLGPGNNNDAGAQNGSFTISGTGGGSQNVNRTGFGVEVGADGGVSNVFQLSDAQINGLTQGLGGGQGSGSQGGQGSGGQGGQGSGLGGNTNMGALSGENNVLAGDNVTLVGGLNNIGNSMNDVSVLGAQNAANNNGGAVPDGTTTYEQLRAASGSGHYAGSGSYSGGGGAYMSAQANIVFGPGGSLGGGSSYVYVNDGTYYDSTDISGGSGAQFTGSGPASFSWNTTSSTGGIFDITATLSNADGVTAEQASVQVTYSTGSCTAACPASGSGVATATLSPGALPVT